MCRNNFNHSNFFSYKRVAYLANPFADFAVKFFTFTKIISYGIE